MGDEGGEGVLGVDAAEDEAAAVDVWRGLGG